MSLVPWLQAAAPEEPPHAVPDRGEHLRHLYADVPEKLHVMAGKSVHSHLKKLAKDGRVAEERLANAPSRWTLL